MLKKTLSFTILLSVLCTLFNKAYAQPSWTIDLLGKQKKPEKFENRQLGSEKMANKKFTVVRHVVQNNFTHYNYYFNANNKINLVLERAKIAQVDNYTKLLSFYPYSLDNTATQTAELDSVILKATAGILLHDLRNDWIDNMYMLMGKAYLLKKNFDTAAATFQFINYNLYPRKKRNEDDDKIVGTNYGASKGTVSIANKEKQNVLQKVASKPPSRNDALVWMARVFIEQEEYGGAAGLIKTLQNDPNLPKRLQNDLDEVYAYWFYKQGTYDSAAAYLEKGLSNADNKQDKSRSEFLLAQLYELTGKYVLASEYYSKASKHTASPLMDIYANLNDAKMNRGDIKGKELDNSINNLLHMANKDKFESYRDIIYYSAAQLEMQKPDTAEAIILLQKSLKYNTSGNNIEFKNKAFLLLGDIAYDRKEYKIAAANYDSVELADTSLGDRITKIVARKNGLSKVVEKINIIERQDSLQMIAALAPIDRDAFLKKLSKKLRKEKGLKEDDNNGGVLISFDSDKNKSIDLFTDNSSKGEWYFYNTAAKTKGFNEFKRKWGKRDNVDNWRRKAAMDANIMSNDIGALNPDGDIDPNGPDKAVTTTTTPAVPVVEDISYDGLLANIPLTEEKMTISNTLLDGALFDLAQLYQNDLEDYQMAIDTYDKLLNRYPDSLHDGKVYLGLYYCYNKLNNESKAAYYKNLLTTKLADSYAAKLLTNPAAANPQLKNPVATERYKNIYDLFIEGKFSEALAEKQKADSTYGKNYWTPQLLYIESIYYVKQKEDSIAKIHLNDLIKLYPSSPLKIKAERLIDVLSRRAEIEKYLTELNITRAKDDEIVKIIDEPVISKAVVDTVRTIADTASKKAADILPPPLDNNIKTVAPVIITSGPFTFNESLPHNVIMLLTKVDGTYINEAKNAFNRFVSEGFSDQQIILTKDVLDADNAVLIFSSFADASKAIEYMNKLRKAAPDEVSWLDAGKYSFMIATDENLQKLKVNKDLTGYKALLNKQYPGKF